jgi:methylmalonyl-CoA mutase C-terminal domain/subunit
MKRVLLAKPGLDGHDRGVKVLARACRDAGFEVIYSGIRQSAASIAETAVQEDVDIVGLSVLSGAHLIVTKEVVDALRERDAGEIPVLVGGTIPARDEDELRAEGATAVFGVSSRLDEIMDYIGGLPDQKGRQRTEER